MMDAEPGMMQLQAKKSQGLPGVTRDQGEARKDYCWKSWVVRESGGPADNLILDL